MSKSTRITNQILRASVRPITAGKPDAGATQHRTVPSAVKAKPEPTRGPDATSQHEVLAKELPGQFRSIFATVRTYFARVEKAVGIGGAQVWALALIEASPGASLGEIAAGMDIHQSTASNLVRLLMAGGFIESRRSADDRRKVELSMTARGRQRLRKAPKPFAGVLPHALATLPANQLKGLRLALSAVSGALNIAPALPKKPLAPL